jgi:hypothetical protein
LWNHFYSIRRSVLAHQPAVLALLAGGDRGAADLARLAAGDDRDKMQRVIEKVLWYGHKIDEFDGQHEYRQMRNAVGTRSRSFSTSVFATCTQAKDFWFAIQYLAKQYGKLITNLVFLQVILLQIDRMVSDLGISVARGAIVGDGAATPPQPAHMKA